MLIALSAQDDVVHARTAQPCRARHVRTMWDTADTKVGDG